MIEHHVLAGINLVGILPDLMGGLYLAYDLLGGRKGPLRTFGLGYGLPLGLTFGLVAGTGLGLALSLEFRSAGPNRMRVRPVPYRTFAFGLFRGWRWGLPSGSRSVFGLASRSGS
jgi:hypothetical protein